MTDQLSMFATRDDQATQDLIGLGSDKLAMLSVIATWTDVD